MANLLDILFGPPKPAKLAPMPSAARPAAAKAAPAAKAPAVPPPAAADRTELIRQAMAVHRAKRKILDDLSDEDRAKLVALAITTLLHQDRED